MALEDFYPWKLGQGINPADLNELVRIIQDGTIFQNTGYITEQLSTNAVRMTGLGNRVSLLEQTAALISIREQFTLTSGQDLVNLSKVPSLDTEILSLNGLSLAKSGIPIGFSGDYKVNGSTIDFVNELSSQIISGDVLVVVYRYEA